MGRFDTERQELVKHLQEKGITDERILQALLKVERHLFVTDPFINRSYEDTALPIGNCQTISQPYTVALMTQELAPKKGEKVLEIGTGSGYQAALLAELGCKVYTIERHLELLSTARKAFDRTGYRIASRSGDGSIGWTEFAPYDCIIVTAAAPTIPEPLVAQLAEGGRMIIPVGNLDIQSLHLLTKHGDQLEKKEVYGFKFVPLIGKKGWSDKQLPH